MQLPFLLLSFVCLTHVSFAATPSDEAAGDLSHSLASSASLASDASGPYLRPHSRAGDDLPDLEPNPAFTEPERATAAEASAESSFSPRDNLRDERRNFVMNLALKQGRDPEVARTRFEKKERLRDREVSLLQELHDGLGGITVTKEGLEKFTELFFENFPQEREHCTDLWHAYDKVYSAPGNFFENMCTEVLLEVESTPLKKLMEESEIYQRASRSVHSSFALKKAEELGLLETCAKETPSQNLELEKEVLDALSMVTQDFPFQQHWKSL